MLKQGKRKILLIAVSAVLLSLLALTVAACGNGVAVEAINIENNTVYLAPDGEFSSHQLEVKVLPENAKNKRVSFSVLDALDSQYLTVSSTGRLKAFREKEEGNITVRVKSLSNPDVFVDVYVVVERARLEDLSFDIDELRLVLGGESVQLKPKIIPAHAAAGASLTYESLDSSIASVSASGVVTPVSKGTTTIKVSSAVTMETPTSREVYLIVKVGYGKLNYYLEITEENVYKQIYNESESFAVSVLKYDNDPSDPNPEVFWYVNGQQRTETSMKGKTTVIINPASLNLNTGQHQIKVVLQSGDERQELELQPLYIYKKLQTFNAVKRTQGTEFEINDTITFFARHGMDEYPPDSYEWYLVDLDDGNKEHFITTTSPEQDPTVTTPNLIGRLSYDANREGNFKIKCYPIIKGRKAVETASVADFGKVGAGAGESVFSGVYFDGAEFGGSYAPVIKWDARPGMGSEIEAVIVNRTTGEEHQINTANNPERFKDNYAYLHNLASFGDEFSVKLKLGSRGYSKWFEYAENQINSTVPQKYFDNIVLDFNGYISNMYELGELINYISIFRPQAIARAGTVEYFDLELFIPFSYDEVEDSYPDFEHNTTPAERANVRNIVQAAVIAYADTTTVTLEYSFVEIKGRAHITLKFEEPIVPTSATSKSSNEDVVFENGYTSQPSSSRTFYIDSLPKMLTVATSNQLYYAASLGYRPVPAPNSAADRIYDKAKEVLRRIIDNSMSDEQKVHAIYDFLTLEVLYDYELSSLNQNDQSLSSYEGFYLEGVFDKGQAVCDGIAKAFNLMAWMEGIQSRKVTGGVTQGSVTVAHAWNKVNISGRWYVVDATWGSMLSPSDNSKELQTHRYLLTTDQDISRTHMAYGEYAASETERSNIFGASRVGETNYTYAIRQESDLEAIAVDYILNKLESGSADEEYGVYIEIYLTAEFRARYSEFSLNSRVLEIVSNAAEKSASLVDAGSGFMIINIR